jgi:hypothetical protein
MTNMRHDVKMRRLINKFGIEGYGLYCAILESIVETMDTSNPIPDLEENSHDIATFFKMDTVRVEEIMLFCMTQGLFDQDELTGSLLCHKVYKFLESSQTRSKEMRAMISAYKKSSSPQIPQDFDQNSVSDKCEEKNRIEKNRIEKNRIEENVDHDDRFDDFWNLYDKKTGKEKCISKWKKLTDSEKDKILETLPLYVNSTPDLKYRKNPLTWLNGKHWEDELTNNTPESVEASPESILIGKRISSIKNELFACDDDIRRSELQSELDNLLKKGIDKST